MLFFDECLELWFGCLVVEVMGNGIEILEEIFVSEDIVLLFFIVDDFVSDDENNNVYLILSVKEVVEKIIDLRRNLIFKFKEKKNFKLIKKVIIENRVIVFEQEEFQLKKRMIDYFEKFEKKYIESM